MAQNIYPTKRVFTMHRPFNPSAGRLNHETQLILSGNRDRARWGTYSCDLCGRRVGVGVRWVSEGHWPSVVYALREKGGPRQSSGRSVPTGLDQPTNCQGTNTSGSQETTGIPLQPDNRQERWENARLPRTRRMAWNHSHSFCLLMMNRVSVC